MISAGTGQRTITPTIGSPIAGLLEPRSARSVADDLYVRALVLCSDEQSVALVLCDLICLAKATIDLAKVRIEAISGIAPSHVIVSCTHTHTAPCTTPLFASNPDPEYVAWVATQIAEAVILATTRLLPAQIATGSAAIEGVSFNRRYHMADGTVVFNPGIRNPDIVAVAGPTDPDVTMMRVETVAGTPIALWASLALHCVGTHRGDVISADYFGVFSQVAQQFLGGNCMGMLTNGASGNINNIDVTSETTSVKASEQARRVASAVVAAAVQATTMVARHDETSITATTFPMTLHRRAVSAQDVVRARHILGGDTGQANSSERFSFEQGQRIPAGQLVPYAKEVLLRADMPEWGTSDIQLIRIGDFQLVAIPGEVFVEFGLTIKEASPTPHTAIVSLANDYVGYMPTAEAFSQGGYETWGARSAWTAQGTGEAICQEIVTRMPLLDQRQPIPHH